jgi:tRNA pseudouridine38-40 synthase
MRFLKLTLAYDGTNYSGWQTQPNRVTLQKTLERALQRVVGEDIRVVASGRTDAGVHAFGQVVGFQTSTQLAPEVLRRALNSELPPDMAVLEAVDAPADFHAIASARRKRYRYLLEDGAIRDVFARNYCWRCYCRLDAAAMHRAGQALVGTHDFASFQTAGSERQTTVRTVFELSMARGQGGTADQITVEIEADGFLYNMVRTIVGTLVEVGQHKRDEAWPAEVLDARDRRAAGRTAPAQGLFLVRVTY